jgi:hypothetical protein
MSRSAANQAFLVGLGGLFLIAAGCNRSVSGSGTVTSTPIQVPASGFSRLEVSSSFDVTVSFGDQENVTLRVDDNVVGHLDAACLTEPYTWAWSPERPCATRPSMPT